MKFTGATLSTLALAGTVAHAASLSDKIKNVVILIQENRSFDTLMGGLTYAKMDNLAQLRHPYCNPVNASLIKSQQVCAQETAKDIAPDDPNHGIAGVSYSIFDTYHPDEAAADSGKLKRLMNGFITEQASTYSTNDISRAAEAINYYKPKDIPVLEAMARSGVLFDRWFADVPGPTNPNRAYITSGTSHGLGDNNNDNGAMPQNNIFQQAQEKGISWINYFNSSFPPDAMFYNYTIANKLDTDHVKPIAQFFDDAKAGKLPQLTYINPECCSYDSFHPPSPITTGEAWLKKVYEAVRNGPQWKETLFILSFDEHGGFGDHVAPPTGVPAGDNITYTSDAPDGTPFTFNFQRLGIRVPTILMSPWVGNEVVVNKPHKNEYCHSSIPAFLAKLWDLENLTPRTAYAATFEHLILDESQEKPATLPNPVQF